MPLGGFETETWTEPVKPLMSVIVIAPLALPPWFTAMPTAGDTPNPKAGAVVPYCRVVCVAVDVTA